MSAEASVPSDPFEGLPGEALIREGFTDLAAGRPSVAALLVLEGRPRFEGAGIPVEPAFEAPADPHLALYDRLCQERGADAYGQYNALLRTLLSFQRALEHRLRRGGQPRPGGETAARP